MLTLMLCAIASAAPSALWLQQLTSPEVQTLLDAGTTSVIIPTGGTEQNGPQLVLDKHNRVVALTSERLAQRLGHTLIAPVLWSVPEGAVNPPSGHMRHAGTLSVRESTFEALLTDTARSLKAHGFKEIILLGDSGGNQAGLRAVGETLDWRWRDQGVRVHFLSNYYSPPDNTRFFEERGLHEVFRPDVHEHLSYLSVLSTVDTELIRWRDRSENGPVRINEVPIGSLNALQTLGEGMIQRHVDRANTQLQQLRDQPPQAQRRRPSLATVWTQLSQMPFNPSERLYWLYLVCAAAIASALYLIEKPKRSLLEFIQPKADLYHPSTLDDLGVLFLFGLSSALLFSPIIRALEQPLTALNTLLFSQPLLQSEPPLIESVIFTLGVFLVGDLGIFLSHSLQHRVPVLWEFHKVHHSAKVLTPLTVVRVHPVDVIGTSLTVFTGLLIWKGLFGAATGHGAPLITLGTLSAPTALFYLLGYNLRHSAVWLSYGPSLSKVFMSPAQHQIHHSDKPIHFDTNMGFALSLWDWMAGTLYVPKSHEQLNMGLGDNTDDDWRGPLNLMFRPFINLYKRTKR